MKYIEEKINNQGQLNLYITHEKYNGHFDNNKLAIKLIEGNGTAKQSNIKYEMNGTIYKTEDNKKIYIVNRNNEDRPFCFAYYYKSNRLLLIDQLYNVTKTDINTLERV